MTENERFHHFQKKVFEAYYLMFRHYIPLGKPYPQLYRDLFCEVYKIYDSGIIEELSKEPILDEEVKQLDMFESYMQLRNEESAKKTEESKGHES